jgi:hypothetical protein
MTTAQFPPTLGAKSPERDRSLNRPRRKRSIAHHRKSRRRHSKPFRHRMPAPIPWAGKTVKPGIYFIDRMWLKIQIKYRMQDIQSENSKSRSIEPCSKLRHQRETTLRDGFSYLPRAVRWSLSETR